MMKHRDGGRLRKILQVTAIATGLAVMPTLTVSAGQSTSRVGQSQILFLSADHSNAVLVPLPGVNKSTYDPNRDAQLLGIRSAGQVVPAADPTFALYAQPAGATRTGAATSASAALRASSKTGLYANANYWTCPRGGLCNNTNANLSSSVTWGGWFYVTGTFAGASHTSWKGCCPLYATAMYLSDQWRMGGISVSVSYPLGIGISGGGDKADWSRSVANTNYINHYFSGIQFGSWVMVCCPSETASGESQFGSDFFTATATT